MHELIDLARELMHRVYNVEAIVRWGGLLAVTGIVFAETGLMIGFFLPGDSLLVTAGLLSAKGLVSVWGLLLFGSAAAVAGDAVGYWIGRKAGEPLYRRPSTWWFRREYLLKAKAFYERHGGKTIVLARFVPIIRTFAPVVAGVAQMRYRRFAAFNVWGGIGWVAGMVLTGFTLGRAFPGLLVHIDAVVIVVIVLSLLPGVVEVLRARRAKDQVE